ncbi:helix-turn-helix domain-containing protein [Streptomyces phyllanthi]|uniref:Helix-turn-helix domain-containing protein n=1 Tax=Streptomyces phyllanthi TaxID=1803180 RepID=A0A5N8W904_9ACTN|nr:helix-turn-helix transcriptional regulator [Streptomyces phyllanthi]MPY43973.1 helix-turn-helix domain-containing protein [Streptomyces phyllanthi]
MGRKDKPVDHSRPARGRLAELLRSWRETAAITYETLASRTGLSPATLKRAASGTVVAKRATVEAYVVGCGGSQEAVGAADEWWRRARVEERGRLAQLHAPRPELIADAADLSRALEAAWEQAGAPSLREIRDRSGNPLALPVSTAARIVNRHTIPADEQQLQAFLTGCGIPPQQHTPWLTAFIKIIIPSPATAVQELPDASTARQQAIRRRLRSLGAVGAARPVQGPELGLADHAGSISLRRILDLLPDATTEQIIASGLRGHLAAEAARNGTSAQGTKPWQPDFFAEHDGRHMVFESKSTSSPGRPGPQAGGAVKAPRGPSGDGGHPAARREPGRGPGLPVGSRGHADPSEQNAAVHAHVWEAAATDLGGAASDPSVTRGLLCQEHAPAARSAA